MEREISARESAAVWVSISDLQPWAENPRKNAAAVAKVAESIRRFGFGAPLVARKADGMVIAGHTRLLAAQQLGLTHVPVRFLDLNPADARLLALADNKLGEIAVWDEEGLARVLEDLRSQGADIAASGFAEGDLDRLLAELNSKDLAGVREPPVPEVPRAARSERGEVYQLGSHRLMCGDSTNAEDVQKLMVGERAPLMATDPPYLVDYDGTNHPQSFEREQAGKDNNRRWDAYVDPKSSVEFFSAFLRVALAHALVENPAVYQWHASRRQALVEAAWNENGLLLHQQLIWVKSRPILTRSHFMWQHEPAFYGWIEGKPPTLRPPVSGECTSVWSIEGEQDGIHPTQKPLEIFGRPIGYHTVAGEIVYEPFGGPPEASSSRRRRPAAVVSPWSWRQSSSM